VERAARQSAEREEELRRVPPQTIDKFKWPRAVRPISLAEVDGLGIDSDGRLHWNGKPVEIIGQRLDLTTTQVVIAIAVATFTALAAGGTIVQAAIAYQDWACKNKRTSIMACAAPNDDPFRRSGPDSD
jgi:hypothetical protein